MQHKFLTMKDASINVTLPFAALAIGDVQQLIRSIVADEVRKVIPHVEPTKPTPDAMTVDQVLPFLSEQGLPTTKKTLYNWIFRGVIPYKHIGRRVAFSRKELLSWIESRTVRSGDRRAAAALRISESANRK